MYKKQEWRQKLEIVQYNKHNCNNVKFEIVTQSWHRKSKPTSRLQRKSQGFNLSKTNGKFERLNKEKPHLSNTIPHHLFLLLSLSLSSITLSRCFLFSLSLSSSLNSLAASAWCSTRQSPQAKRAQHTPVTARCRPIHAQPRPSATQTFVVSCHTRQWMKRKIRISGVAFLHGRGTTIQVGERHRFLRKPGWGKVLSTASRNTVA